MEFVSQWLTNLWHLNWRGMSEIEGPHSLAPQAS